jgi:5-methylcytosine-specific restriction protein A
VSWGYAESKDRNNEARQAIYFDLSPIEKVTQEILPDDIPLENLRVTAVAGSNASQEGIEGKRKYYTRSVAVKAYVLARAGGRCECCNGAAPFQTPRGTPYLEPHHTNMISEGGPDNPRWVAAVCPNCHREIHYGAQGDDLNQALRLKIHAYEDKQEK